mmetsp:Transcript_47579/g.133983  ORF Transcript_47579/g.133983 Transcript_47579/m.133983 type:complete len:205 (-) Transcript_47579:56-670(-)
MRGEGTLSPSSAPGAGRRRGGGAGRMSRDCSFSSSASCCRKASVQSMPVWIGQRQSVQKQWLQAEHVATAAVGTAPSAYNMHRHFGQACTRGFAHNDNVRKCSWSSRPRRRRKASSGSVSALQSFSTQRGNFPSRTWVSVCLAAHSKQQAWTPQPKASRCEASMGPQQIGQIGDSSPAVGVPLNVALMGGSGIKATRPSATRGQ